VFEEFPLGCYGLRNESTLVSIIFVNKKKEKIKQRSWEAT